MDRQKIVWVIYVLLFLWIIGAVCGQDDLKIWKEFVAEMKKGGITAERIRPLDASFTQTLVGWLKIIGEKVPSEQLNATPEVIRVGNLVHYLLPVGEQTYCFTLLSEKDKWYFHHMENIFIRLDKVGSLPASKFPDISEEQKAWAREELYWSQIVYLFNIFSKEKGKEFALVQFIDGGGYFMAAKVWVPFVIPTKAFILYLCWEQANLRGNPVILEKLVENEAIIRLKPIYFRLYKQTSHLKNQIAFSDYRLIFETIWQDRAKAAGWDLQIDYKDEETVFLFRKKV